MAEEVLSSVFAPAGARRVVPLTANDEDEANLAPTATVAVVSDRRTPVRAPTLQPWRLPAQGLAVFHGPGDVARLSHYFLPRLLLEGKRVLFLDGANSANPRLLERFARERNVPFERFNRGIQIARAFTCFQLTELIARVPRFLRDFPAEVLIVTAFPDLYFDDDVRDWNARVAFEQALAHLQRWAGKSQPEGRDPSPAEKKHIESIAPSPAGLKPRPSRATVAIFSAAPTFAPSPVRRRFFLKLCAAASEVWKFSVGADNRLKLIDERGRPRLGCSGSL
jgi:hypothetical protein